MALPLLFYFLNISSFSGIISALNIRGGRAVNIKLPAVAIKAINMLENAGFSAYAVGGFVRDSLLGFTPFDIDISTDATPSQTEEIFSGYTVVKTGIKYGTVTVVIDSTPLEITTFRSEGDYSDRRRPDSVDFIGDVKADCSRRDFTINAMCYNQSVGLLDFFGGKEDFDSKVIRCVGRPEERFSEDPLRMLRALRFSAVLGFGIENETEKAIFENSHLLANIPAERVYQELLKTLCGKNIKNVLMKYYKVLSVFIPPLEKMRGFDQRNRHHIYDVLTHTAVAVENTPAVPQLRMAALLHDIGKPYVFSVDENGTGHFYGHRDKSYELTCRILKNLKVSFSDYSLITTLVKYHDVTIIPQEKYVRRALNRHGEQTVRYLIDLKRADNKAQNTKDFDRTEEYDELEQVVERVLRRQDCFDLSHLAVNGRDLVTLGIDPSPEMGKILNTLLDKVIDGELPNDKSVLLKEAEKINIKK